MQHDHVDAGRVGAADQRDDPGRPWCYHDYRREVEVVNSAVPIDTIVADPLLTTLASRGGPTRTHGLLPGSPAVDTGRNSGGMLDNDHRVAGFAREVGLHADIGAFERQADDDELFYGGFE